METITLKVYVPMGESTYPSIGEGTLFVDNGGEVVGTLYDIPPMENEDVSVNIPGRIPDAVRPTIESQIDVKNQATQEAIKKIFDELNGRGVTKPVLADPEKLARLLTIGLVRLRENLLTRLGELEYDPELVDAVMEEVANSFEYVVLMAQQSGMIKILAGKKPEPPCKRRTVILNAPDLEEQ